MATIKFPPISPTVPKDDSGAGQQLISAENTFTRYEWNTDLTPRTAIGTLEAPGVYDEMLADSVVRGGWITALDSLQDSEWSINAHQDCDPYLIEFAEQFFFEKPDRDYKHMVRDKIQALRVGACPQYIKPVMIDGRWMVADLQHRPLRSFDMESIRVVDGWVVGTHRYFDENGHVKTVQYKPGQLLWSIYGDDTNLIGLPLFRSIHFPWSIKVKSHILAAMYLERFALSIPYAEVREKSIGQVTAAERSSLVGKLEEIRVHERNAFVAPDWATIKGLDFGGASGTSDVAKTIIEMENLEILYVYQAHYQALGLIGEGSRAVGEVGERDHNNAQNSVLSWIAEQDQKLLNSYIDLNFGPQKHYPYLVGKINKQLSMERVINYVKGLKDTGALGSLSNRPELVKHLFVLGMLPDDNIDVKEQLKPAVEHAQSGNGLKDQDGPPSLASDAGDTDDGDSEDNEGANNDTQDNAAMACGCGCGNTAKFAEPVKLPPRPGGQKSVPMPRGANAGKLESATNYKAAAMAFDATQASLEAIGRQIREEFAEAFVQILLEKLPEDPEQIDDVLSSIKLPKSLTKQATKEIISELDRIEAMGRRMVVSEYKKQTGQNPGKRAGFAADFESGALARKRAENEVRRAESEVRTQLVEFTIATEIPNGTSKDYANTLAGMTDQMPVRNAKEFAAGASAEIFTKARDAQSNDIRTAEGVDPQVWYTIIMEVTRGSGIPDSNVCDECISAWELHGEDQGDPIEYQSDLYYELEPPNQYCLGGKRCRCFYVYDWPNRRQQA